MTAAENINDKNLSDKKSLIASEILERIVAMQPRLRERAPQAREQRRVPAESIEELKEALSHALSSQ